jgi:hypothetical protein
MYEYNKAFCLLEDFQQMSLLIKQVALSLMGKLNCISVKEKNIFCNFYPLALCYYGT